jgi:hypothetical protein
LSLFQLVEEDRIRGSQEWCAKSVRLFEQSINDLKAEYQAQANSAYDEKKREILDRLCRQHQDLQRQSGCEIESYLSVHPEKQTKLSILQDHQAKMAKKRSPKTAHPAPDPPHNADEDLQEIFAEMRQTQIDVDAMVVFADGCFLYGGRAFCVGDRIQAETRNPGKYVLGVVSAVTVAELELVFKDSTVVTLVKDDLISRRVVLTPGE